jgi:hypothetical protein
MGHELKGGNSYFKCCGEIPELHTCMALQALIDYKKGFKCMHRQSFQSTLTFFMMGTSGAAKEHRTVHPSCPLLLPVTQSKLSTIIEHATRGLNVKVDS